MSSDEVGLLGAGHGNLFTIQRREHLVAFMPRLVKMWTM
jgi:hypothetical protein